MPVNTELSFSRKDQSVCQNKAYLEQFGSQGQITACLLYQSSALYLRKILHCTSQISFRL